MSLSNFQKDFFGASLLFIFFVFVYKIRKADNCDCFTSYRLCDLATGSLIIVIFSFSTLTTVVCLHLGQNNGKFISTVSARIRVRVLLLQTGHNNHSSFFMILPPIFSRHYTTQPLPFVSIVQLSVTIENTRLTYTF